MSEEKNNQDTPKFVPKQFTPKQQGTNLQGQGGAVGQNSQKIPFLPPMSDEEKQGQKESLPFYQKQVSQPNHIVESQKKESSQKIQLNFGQETTQNQQISPQVQKEYIPKETVHYHNPIETQQNYQQQQQPQYTPPTQGQYNYAEQQAQTYQTQYSTQQTSNYTSDPDMLDVMAKVEEVLAQLKSHSLSMTKLKKEFKEVANNQTSHHIQQSMEDIITQIRSNTLQLSKVDRKYGDLVAKTDANQGQDEMFEQLLALMRTNNLYISKLERRVVELEKSSNSEGDSELLQQIRNNNLQLSKIDKKTNEILHQSSDADKEGEKIKMLEEKINILMNNIQNKHANNLQVIEQKLNFLISNDKEKQPTLLEAIEQKLDALLGGEKQESKANNFQAIEQKLDALMKNGVSEQLNGIQQQMQQLQTGTEAHTPENVGGIIHEVIHQLRETNHQLSGIETKMLSSMGSSQTDEALKVNLKDNKLQLMKLEEQITELLKQTNKL